MEKNKSERAMLADRLAEFIVENNLCEVYGGDAGLGGKGRYRTIGFSHKGTLDGELRVYSPKFIWVRYETAYRDLPKEDTRVFESEKNAVDFLTHAFVTHSASDAHDVPVKDWP